MDRKKFIQNFSRRLTQLMQKEGHVSARSKSNPDAIKLSTITGCSYQMTRKYVLGQALPELNIVVKMSKWLNTSPSWLLFGEDNQLHSKDKPGAVIEIDPKLLKYILMKSSTLFALTDHTENVVNFIVDAIYDAAHLNADNKTIYKIIDMMIASASMLSNKKKDISKICVNGI